MRENWVNHYTFCTVCLLFTWHFHHRRCGCLPRIYKNVYMYGWMSMYPFASFLDGLISIRVFAFIPIYTFYVRHIVTAWIFVKHVWMESINFWIAWIRSAIWIEHSSSSSPKPVTYFVPLFKFMYIQLYNGRDCVCVYGCVSDSTQLVFAAVVISLEKYRSPSLLAKYTRWVHPCSNILRSYTYSLG